MIDEFIKSQKIDKVYFSDNEKEDNNFNYIKTSNGFTTYLKIKSVYLLSHEREEDILNQISIFHALLLNIEDDFQIYKLDKPIDFNSKIEWLDSLIENQEIEGYRRYLEDEKVKVSKYALDGYKEKYYFIKLNSKTLDGLVNQISNLCYTNNEVGQSTGQYGSIHFELINNEDFIYLLKYFINNYADVEVEDNYFVNKNDDYYYRFMTITSYENKQKLRWLINLFNEYEIDTFINVNKMKRDKSLDILSRSLRELSDRSEFEGTYRSAIESELKSADLINFLSNISESFESILNVEIKIKIKAESIERLDKLDKLINQTYKGSFEVSSNLYEVHQDINKVLAFKKVNYDLSIPIPSTSFAACLPFDFNIQNDEKGFLKYIADNSVVFLDPFLIKGQRKSFDYLVIGKKGSGKSVDLKTMIVEEGAKSKYNKVFSLDLDREFVRITKFLGGENVSIGGDNEHYINPLQVVGLHDNLNNIALYLSFLEIFISFLFPNIKEKEMIDLLMLINFTYKLKGIDYTNCLEASTKEYPLFSDVRKTVNLLLELDDDKICKIKSILKANLNKSKRKINSKYYKLSKRFKNEKEYNILRKKYNEEIKALTSYYKFNLEIDEETKEHFKNVKKYYVDQIILQYPFFNKHTTIKLDSHLINFDVSLLKDTPKLYGANIVLILNFLNTVIRKNKNYVHTIRGERNKLEYLQKEADKLDVDISLELKEYNSCNNPTSKEIILNEMISKIEERRPHIRTIFDECHRIIDNLKALNFLIKIVLEGRKYSTGISLATQSFKHLYESENAKEVAILYDELTYKLFLHQEKSAIDYIDEKIELTPSTKQRIIEASKGEGVLIVNNQTYYYKNEQSPYWLDIYGGGK